MHHLKIGYNDVLNMPTGERRFHLGMLVKTKQQEQEAIENAQNNQKGGKGQRKTTISGDALKTRIKSGQLPMT